MAQCHEMTDREFLMHLSEVLTGDLRTRLQQFIEKHDYMVADAQRQLSSNFVIARERRARAHEEFIEQLKMHEQKKAKERQEQYDEILADIRAGRIKI